MSEKSTSKPADLAAPEGARLRTILDSMVEAVFVTDPKGRVTLTNRALEELIAKDVLGRRAKNVIKSKELRTAIRAARKKDAATAVELESRIGEKVYTFSAQVSPLPDDKGVVTVLHDVTLLKNADRIRRDFVANASHELRTPLTAIRGFAETLRDGAFADPEAGLRFSEAILRHTLRLQRLAEDLTVLSQAESPDHDYEVVPVDVHAVCNNSVSSLGSYARQKNIQLRLHVPPGPMVLAVSERAIDHVLINLVENAIKYSPAGSEVLVRVQRDLEQLTIDVQDWGTGIPAKYLDRIFERFYRVDKGRSREEGGTGLGLSIVRHLVLRMGGTIDVKSVPDQGTTFRVVVPIEPSEEVVEL